MTFRDFEDLGFRVKGLGFRVSGLHGDDKDT